MKEPVPVPLLLASNLFVFTSQKASSMNNSSNGYVCFFNTIHNPEAEDTFA
jgi:hypothetical protein